MKRSKIISILIACTLLSGAACTTDLVAIEPVQEVVYAEFDGDRAWRDVDYQVALGPRTPASAAHQQTVRWIEERLRGYNWEVQIQEIEVSVGNGQQKVQNVIAKMGSGSPWLILGAHYDSRLVSDQDLQMERRATPVPGGNDGASGVAVLMEMGRVLPEYIRQPMPGSQMRYQTVWLVFFDAEDNGNLEGWDWILGSRGFVDSLTEKPDAAVIVDMIGDADLNVYMEMNSDTGISQEIWDAAATLGYQEWMMPETKYRILDDHVPFLDAGIPAVDIIDFDYPYWHTVEDTADKVSPESLEIIGSTLLHWIVQPSMDN